MVKYSRRSVGDAHPPHKVTKPAAIVSASMPTSEPASQPATHMISKSDGIMRFEWRARKEFVERFDVDFGWLLSLFGHSVHLQAEKLRSP